MIGLAIEILGGGILMIVVLYIAKKKVCKLTIERLKDTNGGREITGSCIFTKDYLIYQRDFKQERRFHMSIYVHKQSAGTGGSFRVYFH